MDGCTPLIHPIITNPKALPKTIVLFDRGICMFGEKVCLFFFLSEREEGEMRREKEEGERGGRKREKEESKGEGWKRGRKRKR